jgi:hypothetical protein
VGTFNWNWDIGPPADAYSRVSRDLAAVTRSFGSWLDDLPQRLVADYECTVRPADLTDLERFDPFPVERAWVGEPDDPRAAPVILARHDFDGGVGVQIGIGRAVAELLPVCFCDACDEDGDDLIAQAEEAVAVVVGGFREFRQPYAKRRGEMLHGGPWLEVGFEAGDRRRSTASADVVGEHFDTVWASWPRRSRA